MDHFAASGDRKFTKLTFKFAARNYNNVLFTLSPKNRSTICLSKPSTEKLLINVQVSQVFFLFASFLCHSFLLDDSADPAT
jgi:hypothetical protein